MAMTAKCAATVRAAAGGRQISDAKMQLIEDAIVSTAQRLARADRARWQSLSREQRTIEAAQAAMEDLTAQAALKEYRASLQVLRMDESNGRIKAAMQRDKLTRSQGLVRDIEQTKLYGDAIRNRSIGSLGDLMDAAESKDGTGALRNLAMRVFGVDNPKMTLDVVREVFREADGHTGNPAAKAAARAWLDTIEALRQRFNAAGGDIGKLGYGYLSQAHDAVKVRLAGAAQWAAKTLPLLDREQYVNADGSLMNDAAMMRLLEAAHETIATEGANKVEPGQFRGSARANRGSEHRVLHFEDGDAWAQYMREFGEGSLYDAMIGHVGKMARDIALVERTGPNPEQWFRVQQDVAQISDGVGTLASRSMLNQPAAYWAIASGKTGTPENRLIARIASDVRNVQTAAKITWGPLAAMSDVATIAQTLHFDRIPYLDFIGALGRRFSAEHRAAMTAHGVINESLLNGLNRWTGDNLTHSLSGRIANGVMRVSLMNAWTDNMRSAFSDVMMLNMAKKVGTEWKKLPAWDRYRMERAGLTADDWAIISKATPTQIGKGKFLTGDAIRRVAGGEGAATRFEAWVKDEAEFAVVNPDMATRAIVTGGGMPAGTVNGEVMRSMTQFKSFPMAMLTRHWARIFETPQGLEGAPVGFRGESAAGNATNVVAGLAALAVTTTIMGAIQTQLRSVASGKDPVDMTGEHAGAFWVKSFSAGGGAGFLADVLLAPADSPMYGWQGHFGMAGPVAGAAGGLLDIARSNHPAADAVRWVSDQAPFVDVFQTRAMYEHWFLYNAQEMLNPGYLARMRRRAQKQWGQDSWWEPGDALPERAPDMAGAIGQ